MAIGAAEIRGILNAMQALIEQSGNLSIDPTEFGNYIKFFATPGVSPQENAKQVIQKALPEVLQANVNKPKEYLAQLRGLQQSLGQPPTPAQAPVAPPLPPAFPVGGDAPKIQDLVPREALLPEPISAQGQSFLRSLSPFPSKEEVEESRLFGQVSEAEQRELEQARQLFSQESQRLLDEEVGRQREALFPQLQQNISRLAAGFGAQGLGSGGFQGSGALQELARKGSQELESQLLQSMAPERAQNRGLFGQLGLQAYTTPTTYRQSLFGRRLERGDIDKEREFERQLAQMGASSAAAAARAQGRAARTGSIIGGLGSLAGGLFSGAGAAGGFSNIFK